MVTRIHDGSGRLGLLRGAGDDVTQHAREPDPDAALCQQVQVLSLDRLHIAAGANEYSDGPVAKQVETERQGLLVQESPPQVRPVAPSTRGSTDGGVGEAEGDRRRLQAVGKLRDSKKAGMESETDAHAKRCPTCSKCRCPECATTRPLPSCWVCGGRCLCSAPALLEYATCLCCVKGLFYHCSSDDEDVCADDPCSCSESRRCLRWSSMGLLSLLLPCLLCYLPARGCLWICQACYDRATRPGCTCRSPERTSKKPT